LFPHLSLKENVKFGLRFERSCSKSSKSAEQRVGDALKLIQLSSFGERHVHQLSGGEQQHVALAHALILDPSVLLLNEPLGALDAQLRARLQIKLATLQRQFGIVFVNVNHDQHEANFGIKIWCPHALILPKHALALDENIFYELACTHAI
jgi:spermidine/putrescine transport system ATP-binding protein